MKKSLKTNLYQLSASILRNLGSEIGIYLRSYFYKISGMKVKGKLIIYEGVTIYHPYNVIAEGDLTLGVGTLISAREKVKIGSGTSIAQNCSIYDNNHIMPKIDGKNGVETSPIEIGENSWIGARSIILKGVKIGKNVTIGAGSVVSKNIPNNAVAMGNPARIIKYNNSIIKNKRNKQ